MLLKKQDAQLSVKLTPEEQRQAGIELAHIFEDKGKEEARQEDIKKQLKAILAGMDSRITSQSIKVNRGEELRPVQVQYDFLEEKGKVRETRTDTGEIIIEREPYDDERQMVMDIQKESKENGA